MIREKLSRFSIRVKRLVGDKLSLSPAIKKYGKSKPEPRTVLVVGVVLQDRPNHYDHIASALGNSSYHYVHQVWAVLKSEQRLKSKEGVEHVYIDDFIPRSELINSLLKRAASKNYDYIIIVDDDIRLPRDFVDQFLFRQELYDFSLAQPARTPDSIISHAITIQKKTVLARETLFVEIGPLVSIRKDAQNLILPLDTGSEMGWGLDYVWPYIVSKSNQKMGVIDVVPIAHTLRGTGNSYDSAEAEAQMEKYLSERPHLSVSDSHVILKEYV